jgi:hypothetical protein
MSKKIYDYTREEIDVFWDALDIKPINDFFSKTLGYELKLEKVREPNDHRNDVYYSLQDPTNIVDKNPIVKAAWQEMNICTFNSQITTDEETGTLRYWATIHLSYRHWGGGTNGAEIGRAFFTNGEWQIVASQKEAR